MQRRMTWLILAAVAGLGLPGTASAGEGSWPAIRDALFEGRELKDGAGLIALEAPARAQDAAVVPVTVKALQPQSAQHFIRRCVVSPRFIRRPLLPTPPTSLLLLTSAHTSRWMSTRALVLTRGLKPAWF